MDNFYCPYFSVKTTLFTCFIINPLIVKDTGKPKCKRTDLPPFQYYHHNIDSNKC